MALRLLGVDGTPDPGYKSFLNFAAQMWEATLAEIRASLAQPLQPATARCPTPPLLAMGHQPISFYEYPQRPLRY